ncbi:5-oxoprolinase subunit PxpB [Actinomadura livida]|uniref:Allophanate hydrolase subunit 1 n=1 Tax=Actinomadura livida TaxID=79909 RepID=A0A7W7MXG2_9ACTN|nr:MULTISPECIES: 5-oxoprolinase subunit PxpB [Actinomadura]MBB4773887.1 KipI family sensor histidine kinase inhibitor [Actinomadura catellatispora]GGT86379.1 allophanate hydrolase [Actinomadura livida]
MKVVRAGDAALLVEAADLATAHRLNAALRDEPLPGVVDVVPGERTVLVVAEPAADLGRLAERLTRLRLPDDAGGDAEPVEIPVTYDGADLDEVADLTGLSRGEVVRRHRAATYTVAYLGFSPGFGYLTGLDPALRVARRASPRTSVPAGSVAIADRYAAVYPSASPGGWRLLGRSELRLWDVTRDPPSLLRPGMRVRFVPRESP